MHGKQTWLFGVLLAAVSAGGCILREPGITFDPDLTHYEDLAKSAGYSQVEELAAGGEMVLPAPPHSITDGTEQLPPWEMTLEEAIEIAITHSPVMRNLGGAIIRAPATVPTILGPAIQSSEPRYGMEAALSEFDAKFASRLFFEKNNRMLNNFFSAGGTNFLQQDLAMFETELRKQTAGGTEFSVRNDIVFDRNNAAGNQFPQAYDTILETEVRQPLLQGAGAAYNRIAGPNAIPGVYNGVMVARLNTDISVLDFEMALRDLISNVENTYWDLHFAYRDLDAKIEARDVSLRLWSKIDQKVQARQAGGDPAREAQFREQYFRFEQEVQNALTGRLLDGTMTSNGSSGGTFRGLGGVYVCERRLRLMIGLDINDSRLIRPASDPSQSKVSFAWEPALAEAMMRRSEIRRQRLRVQQRALELIAAKNHLLPKFDLVARYRWRGLGHNWLGDHQPEGPAPDPPLPAAFGQSSMENLFQGDFQEWQLGGELTFPVGFRRAHAAVRNAQLHVAREKALLTEQERRVLHDLSNAISDMDRAYLTSQTAYNRRVAAMQQFRILQVREDDGFALNLDQMIDAQRRFADADAQYHRTLAEYMISVKNVHYEKGSLLDYCQVHLAEMSGIGCDYSPRIRDRWLRDRSSAVLDYVLRRPPSDVSEMNQADEVLEPVPIETIEAPLPSEFQLPPPNASDSELPPPDFSESLQDLPDRSDP